MEGPKKTNWADESDEEWSDHEEVSVPQPKTQTIMPDERKNLLIARINKSSFPLSLQLSNLPFRVREEVIISQLHLPATAQYTFLKGADGRFSGSASVILASLEDALLLAEKFNSDIQGRPLVVRVGNEGYSQGDNSYRGDRSFRGERGGYRGGDRGYHGGDRGFRGGDRGYRGGERGHHGGYGTTDSRRGDRGAERNYQGEERNYQGDYQGGRGKHEGGRGNRRGGRNGYFEERQAGEKRGEYRPRETEAKPTKITIAPTEGTAAAQTQEVYKPRSNPFGQAKPVNTLVKDLEFEKKLDETKKVVEEPPKEESKYKIKESHEQHKNVDEVQEEKKEVKAQEVKENKEVKDSTRPAEVEVVELKEEASHERPRENYRGRGGRRGERYRKKYPNEGERVEEQRNTEEERSTYDNRRRGNQRKPYHEQGRRGGDYHNRSTQEIHHSEHTEKPSNEEKIARDSGNVSEEVVSLPRKQSENANFSIEVENKQHGDSENYKRNYIGERRGHGNRGRHEEGGYDSNKRRNDDPNRTSENKPRGNYENRKQNTEKNTHYEVKKITEEKPIVAEERDEVAYKSKYENKAKEANKVKAWGNPDETAEIIKKPKDNKIDEEEKTTKLGSQYVKRKVQE